MICPYSKSCNKLSKKTEKSKERICMSKKGHKNCEYYQDLIAEYKIKKWNIDISTKPKNSEVIKMEMERIFEHNGAKFCILFTEKEINEWIRDMAEKLVNHYVEIGAKEIVAVFIQKGANYFGTKLTTEMSKLILKRHLNIDIIDDIIVARAYNPETNEPLKNIEILHDLKTDIKDRYALLIEDFIDRSLTFISTKNYLLSKYPTELICVALLANIENCQHITCDPTLYIGNAFKKDGRWIQGFGMDDKEKNRSWPFIAYKVVNNN